MKNLPFQWNATVESVFFELRGSLTKASILITVEHKNETIVTNATAMFAIRSVFEKKQESRFHPVAYGYRTLNCAEKTTRQTKDNY